MFVARVRGMRNVLKFIHITHITQKENLDEMKILNWVLRN
jgi:hypothetical protein